MLIYAHIKYTSFLERVDKDLQVLLDGEIEKELAQILGEYQDHNLNNYAIH
jgi:hypothetical protein